MMKNVVRPEADFIKTHTEKAKTFLIEANSSKKNQCFLKAIEEYKVALSHALLFKTEVIPCLLNLAAAHITAGNYEKGAEILNLLLEEKQYADEIRSKATVYGHVLYYLGKASFLIDKDKSKSYFEEAIQKYKTEKSSAIYIGSAMVELAEVYISQQQFIHAVATLQEVSDLYLSENAEKSCHALLKLIELLVKHKEVFTAQQTQNVLKILLERTELIENFISKCTVKNKVASILVSMSMETEALKLYQEVLLGFNGQSSSKEADKIKAHVVYCMAHLHRKKDDFVKASQFVEQAVDLYGRLGERSKQGDCFCIQADLHLQANMIEEAQHSLHHAAQAYKDADNKVRLWQSYEKLGDTYMQEKKYEKATNMYKKAHFVQANGDESSKELVTKLSLALNYELNANKNPLSLKENTEDQNLQVIDPRDDEEEIISTKVNKTINTTVKSEENCIVEDEVGDSSSNNQSDFDENPPVETLSRLKKVVIKVNDEYEEKNNADGETSDNNSDSDSSSIRSGKSGNNSDAELSSTSGDSEQNLKKRRKLKAGRREEVARYRGRGLSAQPIPINEILSESSDDESSIKSLPFVISESEVEENEKEQKSKDKSVNFEKTDTFSTSPADNVPTEKLEKSTEENVPSQSKEVKNEQVAEKHEEIKRMTDAKQMNSTELALQKAKIRKKNQKKRKIQKSKACIIM